MNSPCCAGRHSFVDRFKLFSGFIMTKTFVSVCFGLLSFDPLMDVGGSTVANTSKELQLADHDPVNNGFSLRNAETAVHGAVDPYFKGFGNIVLKLVKNNETSMELEEAYLQSVSLPENL